LPLGTSAQLGNGTDPPRREARSDDRGQSEGQQPQRDGRRGGREREPRRGSSSPSSPSHSSDDGSHRSNGSRRRRRRQGPPGQGGGSGGGGRFPPLDIERMSNGQPYLTPPNSADWTPDQFQERLRRIFPTTPGVLADPDGVHGYHAVLPHPWNVDVIPLLEGHKHREFHKLQAGGQLIFDGVPEKYFKFRTKFISTVHKSDQDPLNKCEALVRALGKVPRCKKMVDEIDDYSATTYADLICQLESMYGGPSNAVYAARLSVQDLAQVKPGLVSSLADFVQTTRGYVSSMTKAGSSGYALANDFKSIVAGRIPHEYDVLYTQWRKTTVRPRNALSMIDWVQETLFDLETRETEIRMDPSHKRGTTVKFVSPQRENKESDRRISSTKTRWPFGGKTRSPSPRGSRSPSPTRFPEKRAYNMVDTKEDNVELTKADAVYFPGVDWDSVLKMTNNKFKKNVKSQGESKFPEEEKICPFCNTEHLIVKCPKYIGQTPAERRKSLMDQQRCFRCLKKGHPIMNCPSKSLCNLCQKKHHWTLHGSKDDHIALPQAKNFTEDQNSDSECEEDQPVKGMFFVAAEEGFGMKASAQQDPDFENRASAEVSLKIVPAILENPETGKGIIVNVLLDDGNNRTVVSTEAARAIGLTGRAAMIRLEGVAGKKVSEKSILAQVRLRSLDKKFAHVIYAKTLSNPAGALKPIDWNDKKSEWPHLKDIKFPEMDTSKQVEVIIGTDYGTLLQGEEVAQGGDLVPWAKKTPLGWVAAGPVYTGGLHRDQTTAATYLAHSFRISEMREEIKNEIVDRRVIAQSEVHKYLDKHVEQVVDWDEFHHSLGKEDTSSHASHCFVSKANTGLGEIKQLLEKLVSDDKIPGDDLEEKEMTVHEKAALAKLEASIIQLENGQYMVEVMWQDGDPKLENNLPLAIKRQLNLERGKHLKSQKARDEYNKAFKGWIGNEKDYLIPVPENEIHDKWANYLPHFPVIRDDKTTTKVRPVLDGSAQYNGKCLNDAIYVGPKVINDLDVVLTRFRRHQVAVGGDVSEMFLRIFLYPEDRKYHRIVFRESTNEPLKHYQFTVHPFGNRGSPCVAIFVIKKHAEKYKAECPRAAETIIESTLVDDNMDSVPTEDEAIKLIADLKKIYGSCGMTITKFISNSKDVLASVTVEERAKDLDLAGLEAKENLPLVKTLGVVWIGADDLFTFVAQPPDPQTKWTKRTTLQTTARLYDPLGFLSPYILRARLEAQEYWRHELEWDTPLPLDLLPSWSNWIAELSELPAVTIPRCLRALNEAKEKLVELHAFADASEIAYATSIYLVIRYEDDTATSILLAAKARVCPLQHVTIPRLELKAALLACEYVTHLNKALKIDKAHIHMWTDSRNALSWIKTDDKHLDRFIANRQRKIRNMTYVQNWRWTPTDQNPADIGSRGSSVEELANSALWWHGPHYLVQGVDAWPRIQPDVCQVQIAINGIRFLPDMDRFHPSSFENLKDLVKSVSRLYYLKLKRVDKLEVKSLNDPRVLAASMTGLIRLAQRETSVIKDAIRLYKKFKRVPGTSPLANLLPRLDDQGVLRMFTRLDLAERLGFDARSPIILCKEHPLVKLLILDVHERLHHSGGVQHTLAVLQKKYWIPRSVTYVRKVLSNCEVCQNLNAHPRHQRMATLPLHRIPHPNERARVFDTCGIDCAGPLYTLQGRGKARLKRYMLIFTCTLYRAVHIEMLYSLDAPSFLEGFTRFVSVRSRPRVIISDNGLNFVRGDSDLKELWALIRDNELLREVYPEIHWHFNTPIAPHTGGIFERMIRSAKIAFYALAKQQDLTDENLHTAFAIIEGTLNSRPLTTVSDDPKDLEPLTPASFLDPSSEGHHLDLAPVPEAKFYRYRWHQLQRVMDGYWNRFCQEFSKKLQPFTKWMTTRPNLKVGDKVIVLENKVRGFWPVGEIIEAIPSADGLVRTVEVRFNKGTYRRPVHNVIPLHVDEVQNPDDVDEPKPEPTRRSVRIRLARKQK